MTDWIIVGFVLVAFWLGLQEFEIRSVKRRLEKLENENWLAERFAAIEADQRINAMESQKPYDPKVGIL